MAQTLSIQRDHLARLETAQGAQRPTASNGEGKAMTSLVTDGFALPPQYPEDLREAVLRYIMDGKKPATSFELLNKTPKGDQWRAFPQRARRALRLASRNARQIFDALWHLHEEWNGTMNGLIFAPITVLNDISEVYRRNDVSDAIFELECRGLIRVMRGRGGRGLASANCYLLTCFPDALGNPATRDYETAGLPNERATANDLNTRRAEENLINARFNDKIAKQVEITRAIRKRRGEPDK